MLDFISPEPTAINLALSGASPEDLLRDLLNKLAEENLSNIFVEAEEVREVFRLDNQLYNETVYRVRFTTPASSPKLDPDNVMGPTN